MRHFLAGLLLALPASAQWMVPDKIAPLATNGSICNAPRTHCLVNFADWAAFQLAVPLAAQRIEIMQDRVHELEEQAQSLKDELALEREGHPKCAVLKVERQAAR